jgi:hypothetical protein
MARIIELVSALVGCVLGLICVLMEAQQVSSPTTNVWLASLWGTARGSERVALEATISSVQQALPVIAVCLLGIALGAYLHAIRNHFAGLFLLWGCTLALFTIVTIVAFARTPFGTLWIGTYLQMVYMPIALPVLTLTAVAISAFASMSVPGVSLALPRLRLRRFGRLITPRT